MKNTVFIITHKEYDFPKLDDYKVLVVGANNNLIESNYLKDNTGDNISNKNNSYCELTGLYWIWKNDNSDHVGLVHYRRYFVKLKKNLYIKGRHFFISKKNAYHILTIDELEDRLKGNDILVKKSRYSKYTNKELLCRNLGKELWNEMEDVINADYRYKEEFARVSSKHQHMNCNMFYGKKEIIDSYSNWLFPLLDSIDLLHLKRYGSYYENRQLGYLSEILFEVWLNTNRIKYDVVDAVNIENSNDVDSCMNIWDLFKYCFIRRQ